MPNLRVFGWGLANTFILLYLAQSRLKVETRKAELNALGRIFGGQPAAQGRDGGPSDAITTSDRHLGLLQSIGANPHENCENDAAATLVTIDSDRATSIMMDQCPSRYQNTSVCEDLGPSCVAEDGTLILYDDKWQPDPADGWYRRLLPEIYARMEKLMFWIAWGGSNADAWLGNLFWFTNKQGFTRAMPAGRGAVPPVPFSRCNTPVLFYWDFPENYYHTLASYATLWAAVRQGAVSADLLVALGLPLPSYIMSHGGQLPEYLTTPLEVVFTGGVTTLTHLARHGRAERNSDTTPWDARVSLPSVRCFARTPVCSVAGYSDQPPKDMFAFMQAVKDHLLGRKRNYDASSPALRPFSWPPSSPHFVTSKEGVLRITLAMRSEGTRKVLNLQELLQQCKAAASIALTMDGKEASVPMACEQWAFGSRGMKSDAWKMDNTDVLVAVHGAGMTNLGFLRPGAIVIELRPGEFRASNADRFYKPLAISSGGLKFWCLRLHGALQIDGAMEKAHAGNPEKYERDKDLLVPWESLRDALAKVMALTYEQWAIVAAAPAGSGERDRGPFTDVTS